MEKIERVKTYIERLDGRLEGGIPKGTVSLICGTAGCMKTSLAYSILYKNAVEGNLKGMYITLEQEKQSLKRQMGTLGMEKESENLAVVDHKMIAEGLKGGFELNWKEVKKYVDEMVKKEGYDLMVIDPLNTLYSLTATGDPRSEVYLFFRELREIGITSFLVSEMQQGGNKFSKYGIADFLSDAIIHLDLKREKDVLERYLGVVKMRYTNHNLQYFPLFYNKDRFIIYTKEEIEL
ncbi:MAG: ATPase domain-containing protein [Euryarchaeota archaeon]|nr:ATPase domain-containing protein [Euryarchaeota archaeon]